jgi:predicted regulator of Ras-like GTPase activity (Roadblock/LC7/MglB family)
MSAFRTALEDVAERVPGTRAVLVLGLDGLPIEQLVRGDGDVQWEALAAECTTLLRASASASADTGLGELRELTLATDKMLTLLVGVTSHYFLFAAFGADAIPGRARFALRLASLALRRELE